MRRTIAVYSVPAAVTAVAWLRLENPRRGGDAVWIVLLAVVPALAPTLRLRLAAAVPVGLLASWVALDVTPLHPRGLSRTAKHGFLQFYDVQVPFGADAFPHMHGVLLLAVFLFCLALALAIAARRPFAAVLAVLVGAGWPATLLTSGRDLELGAAILLAALWILAALRARSPRALVPAAIAGTVLVAAAFAAAGSG